MSVAIINDIRNPSQRTSVLETPFWVSSGLLDASATTAIDDLVVVLFSYPKAGQRVVIMQFVTEVITAFTAGTTATIGFYTLATDAITTGGVATLVDVDKIESAGATYTSAGVYFTSTGDRLTGTLTGIPVSATDMVIGAATTVPAVCATFANAGSVAAGVCRYHMLITIVPNAAS